MHKLFILGIILTIFFRIGLCQNVTAQQNEGPPLLIQQNQVPPPPSISPGVPPAVPTPPPPPPPGQGIPIVQTIPTQTLLANLSQAVTTAMRVNKLLTPGKVWTMRLPAGEIDIKGALLYQGVALAVLHFSPSDGRVLPVGINPHVYQSTLNLQTVKSNMTSLAENLHILKAAEFIEPEACWSFPLAIGNIIVAHIKIYYDGIHVVQDFAANQEMTFYGQ